MVTDECHQTLWGTGRSQSSCHPEDDFIEEFPGFQALHDPLQAKYLAATGHDKGTIGRSRVMPETYQTHRAIYPAYGLELKTVILQNGDMKGFWEAPVEILVTAESDTAYDFTLPCWVGCG